MDIVKNPDTEFAAEILRQIKENNGYCPCALQKSKDTKCRCKAFRDQVKAGVPGACHCGLWIAVEETGVDHAGAG